MTLDSHQVSSNFYELLEKPKNKNCFQLCPNSTWNQIFHSNVWYISRLFFQYQFVSIHSNIECDDIKMPLFCCITVDPIELERIYNSHYGNGVLAIFTSNSRDCLRFFLYSKYNSFWVSIRTVLGLFGDLDGYECQILFLFKFSISLGIFLYSKYNSFWVQDILWFKWEALE